MLNFPGREMDGFDSFTCLVNVPRRNRTRNKITYNMKRSSRGKNPIMHRALDNRIFLSESTFLNFLHAILLRCQCLHIGTMNECRSPISFTLGRIKRHSRDSQQLKFWRTVQPSIIKFFLIKTCYLSSLPPCSSIVNWEITFTGLGNSARRSAVNLDIIHCYPFGGTGVMADNQNLKILEAT